MPFSWPEEVSYFTMYGVVIRTHGTTAHVLFYIFANANTGSRYALPTLIRSKDCSQRVD